MHYVFFTNCNCEERENITIVYLSKNGEGLVVSFVLSISEVSRL